MICPSALPLSHSKANGQLFELRAELAALFMECDFYLKGQQTEKLCFFRLSIWSTVFFAGFV